MAKFEAIKPTRPIADVSKMQRELKDAMQDTVSEGQRWMAEYPAQRLRKTHYRRTGTLKRSWSQKVTASPSKIEGEVGSNANIAPYNAPVQGNPQARLFRGSGWRNVKELKEKMQKDLDKNVQVAVRRALR